MTERKPILLFDLDNTLLDFDRQEAASMRKTLLERGIDPTPEVLSLFSRINLRHWEMLEEGRLTRQEVCVGRFRVFFEELGLDLDAGAAEDSYAGHLCEGHYFVPGAQELLEALCGQYDLYIISNGNARVQDARLASSGITKYFKDIFVSETIGFNKPSREFFDLCFSRIPDFDARRALIIGDSLTSDIRGAKGAGIAACWFNPRQEAPVPGISMDYEIHSLPQLREFL